MNLGKFAQYFVICIALTGCGGPKNSDIILNLRADNNINDGVLLPVDVIAVDEGNANAILGISPESWFGNEMRERLTPDQIKKLAIRSGGSRVLHITVSEEVGRLIIYADYDNSIRRDRQQLIILPDKERFEDSYSIDIKNDRLEYIP